MIGELRHVLEACWDNDQPGSREVGAGRYVQWARWPEGVQIECSGDDTWEQGSLSFLQRRVLAKMGFSPPDGQCPNYYLRLTDRTDTAFGAEALKRCIEEVLQEPDDGPTTELAHVDLGRALLRCFGRSGSTWPYVPEWAIDQLYVQEGSTFVTEPEDCTGLYLLAPQLPGLLQPLAGSRYAVSWWGHGINSYAWTLRLERPGLRLLLQVGYGGVDPDEDQDEELADLFALARQLDAQVGGDGSDDVVVVQSTLRAINSVGRRSDGEATGWLGAHHITDVQASLHDLLRVDVLDTRWESVREACRHALGQARGTGRDVLCFEAHCYAMHIAIDGHDESLLVMVLNSEDLDGREADPIAPRLPLLEGLGWVSTDASPNWTLTVGQQDDLEAPAGAMRDAIKWLWSFDPVKAQQLLYEMSGGDENGGEWT